MYLANRASEFFPEACFAVAHCNFQLRGGESDGDELFVREWCERHGVEFHLRRFDTTGYAARKGISIEMAARDLRYAWFKELCDEAPFDGVAVAHNANDNAETLMLNLLRGTGSKGLRGIANGRDGIILRPMLGISREEIRDWMVSHGCEWREDRTNSDSQFKRNRIRNLVFPVFREINPSFIRTLNEDMERFRQVDDIAEEYYRNAEDRVVFRHPVEKCDAVRTGALRELGHWEYVLFRILDSHSVPPALAREIISSVRSGEPISGKKFGCVTGASDCLLLGNGEDGNSVPQFKVEYLDISDLDSIKQKKGTIVMDAGKLGEGLNIREWRPGDWMRPLGMKGRRKISDIFVDLKWPVTRKSCARVVELDGSRVAALLCEKIDDAVRVTDSTEKIVRISCTES